MEKKNTVYSAGNLLALIGLVVLSVFTFVTSLQVTGFLRTGINLFSSILIFLGSVLPFLLKEMDAQRRMRSIGLRCFTSSFIMSILLLAQTIVRGFASTVPILASLALGLSGIAAYLLSRTGRIASPPVREILLFVSVIIVFSAPMIHLLLEDLGVDINVARIMSVSLLVVFTGVLYFSLKRPSNPSVTGSYEKRPKPSDT
ncbi:MAG: hypothetical protein FGF48_04190 [Candidatus Brockarchaeota archaeon]|nr:hypothetical protein [Candidatus Brockarchaeota archaeon]